MAEAFARAKATLESDTSPSASQPESGEGASASGEEPETQPAAAPEKASPETRRYDERGALQRILQLKREGRLSELSPEARGVLTRFEQEVARAALAEAQQKADREAQMRDVYLTNLTLAEQDPAAYAKLLTEQPEAALFMKSYAQAHPEITLDNPEARPRRSEVEIATEIANEYGRGFEGLVDAIATDGGLTAETLSALKAEFTFGKHPDSANLATFGAKLVTAVAEVMAKELAQKEIQKVKEAERKAYDLQLQKIRGEQANPPRQLSGSGIPDPRQRLAQSGPISMADALREARERLAIP